MTFLRSAAVFLFLMALGSVTAQTTSSFSGTNAPNAFTEFSVTVDESVTNISFVLSGTATSYSHLLVKKGAPPSDTDFDYISAQAGKTNSVNLELPDLGVGVYHIRVQT